MRHPSTALNVRTSSPSCTLFLLSHPRSSVTTRCCSSSHRRITPGRQPVESWGVTQRPWRKKATLRTEVSVIIPLVFHKRTSAGPPASGRPKRVRDALKWPRLVVFVVVNSEAGVATLSRKRAIGSPRDGGRVSVDGEMCEAITGSALSGETGATVAVILPAR